MQQTLEHLSVGSTPTVKPLVWQERSPQCFMAETIAGAYWVDKVDEVWVGYLESNESIDPMAPSFQSEEMAKQSCQSHWNSLVLSLLETETLNAASDRPEARP